MKVEVLAGRGVQPPAVLYWCEDTSRTPFETGIQRVTRRLARGLSLVGFEVVGIGWNDERRCAEVLDIRATGGRTLDDILAAKRRPWLFVPDMPMGLLQRDLDPVQIGRAYGLKTAALVHDVIPLKLRDDYSAETLARYERYFRMFASADLVLATTEMVAKDLGAILQDRNLMAPDVEVVPLPAQFAGYERRISEGEPFVSGSPLRLLTVSTWEPRKNLPRLLRAIRRAETEGRVSIALTIVGRRGHFPAYDAEVDALLADSPGTTVLGSIDDAQLAALYADHHASLYPSLEEGFGLPILESLWLGTPCLCHEGSAMAEIAPGGGVLTIDMADENAIAAAMLRLVEGPDLPRLTAEIRRRPLRSWADYASDVGALLRLAISRTATAPG